MNDNFFNPAVADMNLTEVRAKMGAMCTEINAVNGFIDTFNDNFIADLRRRSKALGEEIMLEIDPTSRAYVVTPQIRNLPTAVPMPRSTRRRH